MKKQNVPYQENGVLEQANPWLIAAREQLKGDLELLHVFRFTGYEFAVKLSADTVWLIAHWQKGGGCAFRVANCAGAKLHVKEIKKKEGSVNLVMNSALGVIHSCIEVIQENDPLLHWSTTINSPYPMLFSCMPRDIYPIDERDDPFLAEGKVYSKQEGPKAGVLYLTIDKPETGSVLYMQNFTALNSYFERTHTAPANVVEGKWPELGFSLPSNAQTPLPANTETIISDALILLTKVVPRDEFEAADQYLDMQVPIYFQLGKPETSFHDYLSKAMQAIHDLDNSAKCFMEVKGQKYLRPYVDAEDKPPESMVQLAVLMPLAEYENWFEEQIPVCSTLRQTISQFYNPKLKTIMRYLSGVDFSNVNKEPQEDPMLMDSWYLFHPLLNLARLAKKGYSDAEELFFNSIDYAIEGAHRFNYHWPVFYRMDSFQPEQSSDPQGETDVACIYALAMVHAYELSNDKRFLQEAEKAAESISNLGFNLPYQINVTAFGASAFMRLYKLTGKDRYRKLVSLCIANIFSNSWLWECNYGYAKNYRTFIGIPPLAKMHDNDYLASYEEFEVLSAFDDLCSISEENDLRPSIRMLIAEFAKYVLDRCWSYFPSELPKDMITEKSKTGKIDPALAFPLEDLREGWQKAGQIGQEVYGAGGVFIAITRHFNHKKDWPFTVFCEYPTKGFEFAGNKLSLHVCGDERLKARLRIIPFKGKPVPATSIFKKVKDQELEQNCSPIEEGVECFVEGNSELVITWSEGEEKVGGNKK